MTFYAPFKRFENDLLERSSFRVYASECMDKLGLFDEDLKERNAKHDFDVCFAEKVNENSKKSERQIQLKALEKKCKSEGFIDKLDEITDFPYDSPEHIRSIALFIANRFLDSYKWKRLEYRKATSKPAHPLHFAPPPQKHSALPDATDLSQSHDVSCGATPLASPEPTHSPLPEEVSTPLSPLYEILRLGSPRPPFLDDELVALFKS